MDPSDSRRLKRFSLKSLLSSCRRPTGCCARLSAVLSFRCWPLACRPDRVNAIVSRLGGCVIRVNVQADGFDLTAQIRGFVETQVLAALGRFDASIALVEVHLGAVRGRATLDKTVCSVIVTLHPHGDVRSIASHAWMNVAITRAACDAGSQVDQELRRRRHTAAPGRRATRESAGTRTGRQPNLAVATRNARAPGKLSPAGGDTRAVGQW